jgi:hypothetical protein
MIRDPKKIEDELRNLETDCVSCGKQAVKYCDGLLISSSTSKHGSFTFSCGCGLPVCKKCNHNSHKNLFKVAK